MRFDQDGFDRDQLRERAASDEPLIEPMFLEQLEQANLPFRGPLREEAVQELRMIVSNRRTVSGIASRIATQVSNPITNAVQNQTERRVQERLVETIQNAAEDNRSMTDARPIRMGPGIIRDIGEEE